MAIELGTMSRNGAPPANAQARMGTHWWLAKEPEMAAEITGALEYMREHQNMRITQWVVSARLYGNMALTSRPGLSFAKVASSMPWLKERLSWNIVQACVDTVTAKMVKNKPKPLFLTKGGDYKLQRKAKKLNQFIDGVFYENDAYELGGQVFLDGAIWGDGIIHVFIENKRVKFERVMASELWTDDIDGFYGKPRNMHRVTDIDRAVLKAQAKKWIRKLSEKDQQRIQLRIDEQKPSNPENSSDTISDKVEVAESWHLPSTEDGDDGLHIISIKDCVIVNEKWKHDFFPFARFRWAPRPFGYYAQGLGEQLQNIQLEINTLLQTIKQSFWKGGTFRVFLPIGSRLSKDQITNQISTVVTYSGDKAPTIVTPQLVQQEIFEHLNTLWNKGFEQSGVSLLSATSQKPAGLNSGRALREYDDIQTDRFMKVGQEYERFFLALAKLSIAFAKEIGGSYKVRAPVRNNVMQEIDWADVDLKEDEYLMQCFPISSLPDEPAARLETLAEWMQAGLITPRQYKRLADFPDLDMAQGLSNAAEDYLTDILEDMLYDEGKYVAPEPYDDLVLAEEMAMEYYQRGKVQHMPDDKLELLRRFMADLDRFKATAQAANQAQQQAAAGAPDGAGGPPPSPPRGAPPKAPTAELSATKPAAQALGAQAPPGNDLGQAGQAA